MLAFLVCGLTLLFTPNGKFEDAIMFSRLEAFLDQKQSVIVILDIGRWCILWLYNMNENIQKSRFDEFLFIQWN